MPFGLCNTPATFQRLVMYIFTDLLFKSITVYIDDLSTQSSTRECVREALIRYRQMRLALNPDKTFLGVQRRVLLGYVVSEKRKRTGSRQGSGYRWIGNSDKRQGDL